MPLVKLRVTGRLEGNPLLELLPNASRLLMIGWVPKIEPAVALVGWVAKTNVLAAAGLTAMVVEVVLTRLVPLKVMVMLVATLCDRLV